MKSSLTAHDEPFVKHTTVPSDLCCRIPPRDRGISFVVGLEVRGIHPQRPSWRVQMLELFEARNDPGPYTEAVLVPPT